MSGVTYYAPAEPLVYVTELPPGAVTVDLNGVTYFWVDNQYYLPTLVGSRQVYALVQPQ